MYDLVMIQYNVPLLRNPHLDLIRIDKAPVGFNRRDCQFLEKNLNFLTGQSEENSDLAVRMYK